MINTNIYGHFDKARKSLSKFEKVDEIRAIEESVFGLETVKDAMKFSENRLIDEVKSLHDSYNSGFFSEEDFAFLTDEAEWDLMFRGFVLYSLSELAVTKHFDDEKAWSIKRIFIRTLKEEFNEELALQYIKKMESFWLQIFTWLRNVCSYANMVKGIVATATEK